ncbi:hypothetical protein LK459_08955 [Gordonia otitidis]|uniref:hypothetical protein n=1 Tax=Gordonia otitidis TaxID=249058 RepID=UPI001D13DE14|nr:hypothetical protein [Gordonia otitidis]UEA60932.1 hypothetical protein LK459_08955 [Gordonia otitidis]
MSDKTIRKAVPGRRTRRATVVAALTAGAGALTIALAAPASANVQNPVVTPGIDGKVATTCEYNVTVPLIPGAFKGPVTLKDGNQLVGTLPTQPNDSKVVFRWTPNQTGNRTLTASQTFVGNIVMTRTADVFVVPGLNLGSLCIAQ